MNKRSPSCHQSSAPAAMAQNTPADTMNMVVLWPASRIGTGLAGIVGSCAVSALEWLILSHNLRLAVEIVGVSF